MNEDIILRYPDFVEEVKVLPHNTLQMFITDKCNLRCEECFYKARLGAKHMSFDEYKSHVYNTVYNKSNNIEKITILGGEPTLHPSFFEMLSLNELLKLKTTVYTNGIRLEKIMDYFEKNPKVKDNTIIRLGVHGLECSDKPLNQIPLIAYVNKHKLPIDFVYMLATYNLHELKSAIVYAKHNFNVKAIYLSSIRELDVTGDYWLDTPGTIPIPKYAKIIQDFVDDYDFEIPLHISTRGLLVTESNKFEDVKTCRFGNVMRNGEFVISPFDISQQFLSTQLSFGTQECKRHHKCVLQKIVLKSKD